MKKKTLPQWLHLYNLSIECVFKFHLRLHFIDKALAHLLHWYVFSPTVYFKMPYKLNIIPKALSHSLHWHGSSPVWVNICKLKIHWNKSQCVIRIQYTLKMTEIVFSSDLFRRILLFCFNKKNSRFCHKQLHAIIWPFGLAFSDM